MTNEEKQLLLIDLCPRLPYGVMLYHSTQDKPFELLKIRRRWYKSYKEDNVELAVNGKYCENIINDHFTLSRFSTLKPYLRPMSSMTEEEKKEWERDYSFGVVKIPTSNNEYFEIPDYYELEWLNEHHFDYRGLIEKGLALEAPEGMYNWHDICICKDIVPNYVNVLK